MGQLMRSILVRLAVLPLALALLGPAAPPARAVSFEWITIDDPGNPPDDAVMLCCRESMGMTGFGPVDYVYRISRTELTNAQYAEFLNAVASVADPNALFNTRLQDVLRAGGAGSYSYAAKAGRENHPVRFIEHFDGFRFANWLHNGQPSGLQDETTTEDGAYTLLGANPVDVVRNEGASFFVPSEDEWYKAAFWDPVEQRYWSWATGFNPDCPEEDGDCPPVPEPPPGAAERVSANYCPIVDPFPINCPDLYYPESSGPGNTTDVGAYVFSPSPFGTFDQSGNLNELTEGTNIDDDPSDGSLGTETRVTRGGVFNRGLNDSSSHSRLPVDPNNQMLSTLTLRVATVPEPGSVGAIVALGVVLGLARWRRPATPAGRTRLRADRRGAAALPDLGRG
jgi:formylglycine-generating enzyme required for sulfatase activity